VRGPVEFERGCRCGWQACP